MAYSNTNKEFYNDYQFRLITNIRMTSGLHVIFNGGAQTNNDLYFDFPKGFEPDITMTHVIKYTDVTNVSKFRVLENPSNFLEIFVGGKELRVYSSCETTKPENQGTRITSDFEPGVYIFQWKVIGGVVKFLMNGTEHPIHEIKQTDHTGTRTHFCDPSGPILVESHVTYYDDPHTVFNDEDDFKAPWVPLYNDGFVVCDGDGYDWVDIKYYGKTVATFKGHERMSLVFKGYGGKVIALDNDHPEQYKAVDREPGHTKMELTFSYQLSLRNVSIETGPKPK
ncbi:uncharacterized protein LOC135398129 [Ornithodoros turicata]|uniref:uncharacterized protein LOC135398129 n=1 Tax=Ornithodoros turicata TaxID=34597 RepID=UPI003138787B